MRSATKVGEVARVVDAHVIHAAADKIGITEIRYRSGSPRLQIVK
jgi:hypothetical protein